MDTFVFVLSVVGFALLHLVALVSLALVKDNKRLRNEIAALERKIK